MPASPDAPRQGGLAPVTFTFVLHVYSFSKPAGRLHLGRITSVFRAVDRPRFAAAVAPQPLENVRGGERLPQRLHRSHTPTGKRQLTTR